MCTCRADWEVERDLLDKETSNRHREYGLAAQELQGKEGLAAFVARAAWLADRCVEL